MAITLHCPECGEEYVASALRCVDCGVALVSGEPGARPAPVEELPPVAQLVCLRTANLGFVQGLSEQLAQAGISHRIEALPDEGEETSLRRPGSLPYGVFVRQQDVDAALEVDRAHMRHVIPDLPAEGVAPAGGEGCPACGAAITPDAAECSDCGLALVADA
jgi:hypothetical protein